MRCKFSPQPANYNVYFGVYFAVSLSVSPLSSLFHRLLCSLSDLADPLIELADLLIQSPSLSLSLFCVDSAQGR
jgi:hypothetical protein